jgi:hypothetical protein
MQTNLKWKKGILSNEYTIYSNDEKVGKLKDKTFTQVSEGEFRGKGYIFRTKGFLKQKTEIIDSAENKVIGKITYNDWMTKAKISVHDKTISWKYNSIWQNKWSLFDNEGINVKYSGSSIKGKIDSTVDDPLLILSGLVVTNYYGQMSVAIIIAVFIPVWVTVFI